MFVSCRFVAGVSLGLVAAAGSAATANPINFSFSHSIASGHAASTSLTFETDGGGMDVMVITLTNEMELAHATTGSRALTGLFFDMVGDPTISTSNVSVAGQMVDATGNLPDDPTDYWAFRQDLDSEAAMLAGFGDARYGLGAAGFGVFEYVEILGVPSSVNQPNGIDGGILSATGTVYTGQNQTPLVRTTAVFTFELGVGFLTSYTPVVENVSFQFGSGFDEPSLHLIPLPGAAGLAMAGFGMLGIRRRR